jgi:glycosyltransferase involved in cell wall biosynthesis
MVNAPLVDVVLPCLDEASALPWVLDRMPPDYRPIVVDNGSTDGSADVARQHGAVVIEADVRGFGAACHAGLTAATSEVVCFLDADASMAPAELERVTEPVLRDEADLVLGRRTPSRRDAWPAHARLANAGLALLLRHRGIEITDLGPMRAVRRQPLIGLHLRDRRFGYPLEMLVAAARSGWRVIEVPVSYHPRIGRSKVTGTVRGTVRAAWDMQRVLVRESKP